MSARAEAIVTAGLRPELFAETGVRSISRTLVIATLVVLVLGGFAFRAGKEIGLRAPVWQKGFSDSQILDGGSYEARRRYIHENPVTRGLVSRSEEFPHSSAYSGFELDPSPFSAAAKASSIDA